MTSSTFITGATGVVGSDLLRALVERGDSVTALVRTATAGKRVAALGASPVLGDLTEPVFLAKAMWGSDVVFHVAGVNEGCPKDPAYMDRVNIDGAASVVEAAAEAGAGRVVLTSSVTAIGESEGMVGTEQTRHCGTYVSAYARSKHLGEQAAVRVAEETSVDLVVVNPASVQGPGRSSGSAELIVRVLRSERPLLVDVTVSIVDIADCTKGHILAAERGKPGERYILSGATISVPEAVALINEVEDTDIRPRWLSPSMVRALGIPLSRVIPSSSICPDLVRSLLHGHKFDNTKSRKELGIEYTPIADTFRRTIAWFRHEGLV